MIRVRCKPVFEIDLDVLKFVFVFVEGKTEKPQVPVRQLTKKHQQAVGKKKENLENLPKLW